MRLTQSLLFAAIAAFSTAVAYTWDYYEDLASRDGLLDFEDAGIFDTRDLREELLSLIAREEESELQHYRRSLEKRRGGAWKPCYICKTRERVNGGTLCGACYSLAKTHMDAQYILPKPASPGPAIPEVHPQVQPQTPPDVKPVIKQEVQPQIKQEDSHSSPRFYH